MRIAVLIISLCLSIAVGLQSLTIFSGGSFIKDDDLAGGGAVGVLVALLFVLGAAFAIGLPRVAAACFAVEGLLGLAAGNSTKFGDLAIWGGVAIALAAMSWFGSRELRRKSIAEPLVAAQAPDASYTMPDTDVAAQLERLAKLRAEKSISEAEFESLKARVLRSHPR